MSTEEITRILNKPKSIAYSEQYKQIYYQLTGKQISGCVGCKLTWLYNTLQKLNKS